jgi:hypothetical protein
MYYGDSPGGTPSCNQAAKDALQLARNLINQGKLTPGVGAPAITPVTITPVVSYQVRVTADALNVRNGPGTLGTAIVDTIRTKGTFTVVAEANAQGASKWGQLQGSGWISLDFTTKVETPAPPPAPPAVSPARSEMQQIIQGICNFSSPQTVWNVLDKHAFADSLYVRLATVLGSKTTREECKAIIQARCRFSSPEAVWAVIDQHPFADDLYLNLADMMVVRPAL